MVSKSEIIAGLKALGIKSGDLLMVHSSYKSFGDGGVEGGPKAVIEALMDVVTQDGILMMPSFNQGFLFENGEWDHYDPIKTPSMNGIITETFRLLPGVYRSLDPTHSVCAWGRGAEEIVSLHHRAVTIGPDSPLGILGARGGSTLLIGVGYTTNSFHHVAEVAMRAPCLGIRTEIFPVKLPDGRLVNGRSWGWRSGVCPYTDNGKYGEEMKARGLESQTVVGSSTFTYFKQSDCLAVLLDMFTNGKYGFPPCAKCDIRPLVTERTVDTDYDLVNMKIKEDSESRFY